MVGATVFNIIDVNQASVDNGGSNNGGEVNSKTSSQIVDKMFEEKNPELGETVFHIGGVGDTVFQEIVAVSTLTPPRETVNNFLYEEQQEEEEEEEEEMLNQGGGLAPIYVEVSHDFLLSVHIRLSPAQPPPLSCYLHILSLHLSFLSRPSNSLCVDISSTSRLL